MHVKQPALPDLPGRARTWPGRPGQTVVALNLRSASEASRCLERETTAIRDRERPATSTASGIREKVALPFPCRSIVLRAGRPSREFHNCTLYPDPKKISRVSMHSIQSTMWFQQFYPLVRLSVHRIVLLCLTNTRIVKLFPPPGRGMT